MSTREMVERVAFAICGMTPCMCKNKLGFEGMICLDRARKAIEAMREPTEEMLDSGYYQTASGYGDKQLCKPIWRAMIDEALS